MVRARTLFLASAAAYLAAGLWYASRLRVSGDEPHYLLMAQSLWREGDPSRLVLLGLKPMLGAR